MSGAADSDPNKWSPLKRMLVIAAIVIFASVLVGFLLSLGLGFFYIGVHAALNSTFISIITQGWNLLFPYKFVIPVASGFANQFLAAYFFDKTVIQKKIDIYSKCIKQPGLIKYPHCQHSLELLRDSINGSLYPELKNSLFALYNTLFQELARAHIDKINTDQVNYLRPIIFAATAFAYNLAKKDTNARLLKLSFYALKGAGFTEPPNQNILKKYFVRALPVILIIAGAVILAVVFSSFYLFLFFSTVSAAINIISECVSLVPKNMMQSEYAESSNKVCKNNITESILELEKKLPLLEKKPPLHSSSDKKMIALRNLSACHARIRRTHPTNPSTLNRHRFKSHNKSNNEIKTTLYPDNSPPSSFHTRSRGSSCSSP